MVTKEILGIMRENVQAHEWKLGSRTSLCRSEPKTPKCLSRPKKTKLVDSRLDHTNHAMQIDEDLHSRQLAVYGRASMRRMAASDILICGALGLGVETGTRLRNAWLQSQLLKIELHWQSVMVNLFSGPRL